MLALQIIQLFKDVFQGVGLDLYLVPYRVVATAMGVSGVNPSPSHLDHTPLCAQCGVIECVPDSKSRDQLGKATQVSLKAYFNSRYGDDNSVQFQQVCDFLLRFLASWLLSFFPLPCL